MKITDIRINGIHEPLGFSMPHISVSFKVTETDSRQPVRETLTVAADPDFSQVLFHREAERLNAAGEPVELTLTPRTRYYVRITVTGDNGDTAIGASFFETGKMQEEWQAHWIAPQPEDKFHPVFFRHFEVSGPVQSARLYISGLGLFEACLNGQKAGQDFLAPFCNDYSEQVQVQTYDVTDLLRTEGNTLEIYTGNGWYKGRLGYEGGKELYGDRFEVLAELHITLRDGTCQVVETDQFWEYRGSDFELTDLYDGECLNRQLWEGRENPARPAAVLPNRPIMDRLSLPVIPKAVLPVAEVIHTPAGETVLDMGQNFAGCMEYEADFPAGTRIVLDHGEILQEGNFYNDNYRTAKAQMIYVSGGQRETVRAHFTFFGFRYVRVTGWPGEVSADRFRGLVLYSDLPDVISFTSGNSLLNRLFLNTLWGQRSNFLDIPTDCPQRDERLGWTGDAQVFSPTACFQMDTRAFYRKYLHDIAVDQQKHEGRVANYLPNVADAGGASVWGDIATFLPMTLYQYYGDRAELAAQYPIMRDWLEWIRRQDEKEGGRHLWDFGFHFGDWLAQDGVTPQSMKGGTDDYFVASMYYYASARKVEEAAKILEKPEDADQYGKLAEAIYAAILHEYFSPSGRLCIDTQTAYLLCLNFGVYLDKSRIVEGLKKRFQKDCYRIRGGFVGATMMCRVLAENGLGELAAYFLFQEGFPGWMHCVKLGATTIWERWNSVLDDGRISGTEMNSLNHYSYGSVMEYVYRDLAGIRPLEPGFARVCFAPQPTWRAMSMEVRYDSVHGVYGSRWEIRDDGQLSVRFEVPFGCTAEAHLPGTEETVELGAGVFEKTYRPQRDYRIKYSMDSWLGEMKEDPEAQAILREDLPAAYDLLMNGDEEFLSMRMQDLQFLFFRGFNPQMVQEGTRRLFELKAR